LPVTSRGEHCDDTDELQTTAEQRSALAPFFRRPVLEWLLLLTLVGTLVSQTPLFIPVLGSLLMA
jgi:hypothetical protein